MQALNTRPGLARSTAGTVSRMIALAGALVVALMLAGAAGYWLKELSLQSPPAATPTLHVQPPDAIDRNAAVEAPRQLPPDAVERNQAALAPAISGQPAPERAQLAPDASDRNRAESVTTGAGSPIP